VVNSAAAPQSWSESQCQEPGATSTETRSKLGRTFGAYFGEKQLIGPVNHMDLHPSVDLHPVEGVTVTPSWDFFLRESLQDAPAVMVTVAIGCHVSIAADGEYFVAGPFLRDTGPARNVTYVGSWIGHVF
jgi:hypothetical protein